MELSSLMRCLLTALFLLVCSVAFASENEGSALWFPVGETLHYKMRWGIIPIGSSRVETSQVDAGGKKLILIRYYVKTNRVFDKIYPVNDFMETLVDPEGFVPVTARKKVQRRTPQCDELVVFNREKGSAEWYSKCMGKNGSFDIEADTRDIMSLLYYMRKTPLSTGMIISNKVVVTHSITDMKVHIGEKKTMDIAGIDDVECFKAVPVAKLDDLLVEEGEVEAWVSSDERRIITRLNIAATFGKIRIRLCGVSGPGKDRWTQSDSDCADSNDEEENDK